MSDRAVSYSIREAVPADYPALVPIADQVHGLHARAHPAIFQPVERATSLPQAYFDDLLSGELSTIQVVEMAARLSALRSSTFSMRRPSRCLSPGVRCLSTVWS